MLRKDTKVVSIKWIQFCKVRPGELDLFSLRHKRIWCLYKKIIMKKVKAVQSKHKYSHKEKKEYKQSRINTGWKLVCTLENFFFFQSGSDKKAITLTKGLVKEGAVVPGAAGEWQGGLSPSSPRWPLQLGLADRESVTVPAVPEFVQGICNGINCFSNPGPGYLLALDIFIFHICRLKYCDL